jgi:tetratricopeptide (TPR) repeat protein
MTVVCPACEFVNPDGARFCAGCGKPLDAPAAIREVRKTVTVVFCDVTGSTALGERLDPESLRHVMARYFEAMRTVIERHGGTVEKFIGDAVNVAARLEQAAAPGEIVLGPETMSLLRGVVTAEELEPLELKGKAEGVRAFRLVSVDAAELPRRLDAPMVGRQRELRLLGDAWERASSERTCLLFTLLGAAGIGKSRLTEEFLAGVDATLVRGRCLSYGEGITYWPATEIVLQLAQLGHDVSAGPLAGLVGEGTPTSPEEIALAFRRLLEQAAAERPLLVLFDDMHWGEPALLDLIEHVATMTRGAPILVLCLGRPELLDRKSAWGGGLLNATTVRLEPLSAAETEELITALGSGFDADLVARIRDAADGNPLFVEEMTAMVEEGGDAEVVVPPKVQALLAARLDQLDGDDRSVLERGAVEGQVFHRGAVQALGSAEADLSPRLSALVRTELVRPEAALFAGNDAYRFRHILIRDAAYDSVPKATRAELHERLADWLEEHGADLLERDEILGHHLEQAYRYRAELGPVDGAGRALAARAAALLRLGAEAARLRGDLHAAELLLSRAAQLLPDATVPRAEVELQLVRVLFNTGDFERAAQLIDDAKAIAEQRGDERVEALAVLEGLILSTLVGGPDAAFDPQELDAPIHTLERLGDEIGLAQAMAYLGRTRFYSGKSTDALEACGRAIELARRHGLRRDLRDWQQWEAAAKYFGSTRAAEAAEFLDQLLAQDAHDGVPPAVSELVKAALLAMGGDFDSARELVRRATPDALELGVVPMGMVGMAGAHVELLAGAPQSAVELLTISWERYGEIGETGFRSTVGTMLAEALLCSGREAEAEGVLDEVETFAAPDDFDPQARMRWVRALVLSRRGEPEEAERLAREAVGIVAETDYLEVTADAYLALARVLDAVGKSDEAQPAWRKALELYERKGVVPRVAEVKEHLAE